MDYYELTFDESDDNSWELEVLWQKPTGEWFDVWAFSCGKVVDQLDELRVAIFEPGHPVDFNLANFNIPIVSKRLGNLLESSFPADIQRIPISIGLNTNWEILNVLNVVDCLDHERSVIDYYPTDADDETGPRSAASQRAPRGVRLLRVDNKKTQDRNLFRIKDWTIPIAVSSHVKAVCEAAQITGASFLPIT